MISKAERIRCENIIFRVTLLEKQLIDVGIRREIRIDTVLGLDTSAVRQELGKTDGKRDPG